jgi:hypothetical protein
MERSSCRTRDAQLISPRSLNSISGASCRQPTGNSSHLISRFRGPEVLKKVLADSGAPVGRQCCSRILATMDLSAKSVHPLRGRVKPKPVATCRQRTGNSVGVFPGCASITVSGNRIGTARGEPDALVLCSGALGDVNAMSPARLGAERLPDLSNEVSSGWSRSPVSSPDSAPAFRARGSCLKIRD